MGKASSSKKVARAASTGGGRTSRGTTPWGWWAALSLIAVLGIAGVVVSRNSAQDVAAGRDEERPRVGDHWHAAVGWYLCDEFAPPVQASGRDPQGIHTHNEGVIHIHPFVRSAAGNRATFDVFLRTENIELTETVLKLPGGERYEEGKTKCGDKPGELRVLVNGEERTGDPRDVRFEDRDLVVVAFAPEGAEVPKEPPSAPELDRLTDVPGSPGATTSTAQVPSGTPTSAPGEQGGTTVPAPPTTTASSTPTS